MPNASKGPQEAFFKCTYLEALCFTSSLSLTLQQYHIPPDTNNVKNFDALVVLDIPFKQHKAGKAKEISNSKGSQIKFDVITSHIKTVASLFCWLWATHCKKNLIPWHFPSWPLLPVTWATGTHHWLKRQESSYCWWEMRWWVGSGLWSDMIGSVPKCWPRWTSAALVYTAKRRLWLQWHMQKIG